MQKQYANITEEQSMEFAMTPGISARTNHILLPKDDYYKNSGYGLYMTKELALAYGGSFIICSGKSAIIYILSNLKINFNLFFLEQQYRYALKLIEIIILVTS